MALTKEETLQQAYSILEEDDDELQKKIFDLKTTQQNLKCEIENLTKNIELLEKQKAEKSWKITCFNIITFGIFKYYKNKKINEQIRKTQIESQNLITEKTKNTNIKWSLKNKRLKVATKMINILKNLLSDSKKQVINVQTEIHQEISQKLDTILEYQSIKTIDHTNSSSLLMSDSSGYNSDDEQQLPNTNSRLQNDKDSDLKQSLAITCKKSNHNDDGIEVISESEEDDGIEVISESEEDDGIEVISESEEDDNISERKNSLLERQNSEDSALGSELKQSGFDQKSVNSYDLIKLNNSTNKSTKSYQQNEI